MAEHATLAPGEILRSHPHLTVTSITPFGLEGPWRDKAATEFTLQAWSGAIIGLARGRPDRAPVFVGGQIGEWLSGVFGAIGTLASVRRSDVDGELVDVSMLEALAMCLTYYPVTFHDQLGRPMRRRRYVPTPGVGAARDGLVGLGCGTGQQWLDFCVMVEHPEWMEDPRLFLDRTALAPTIDAWIARAHRRRGARPGIGLPDPQRTDRQRLERHDVRALPRPGDRSWRTRGTARRIRDHPSGSGQRASGRPNRLLGSASTRSTRRCDASAPAPAPPRRHRRLPFQGLRVLDMTAYWAGPFTGHLLALLGAEVIHLESPSRPDGVRLVGGVPQTEDRFWERGPIFAALNTNKKSMTIDIGDPRGIDLVRRFIATCDVVVENYTPRVLDQLGLDYETLRADPARSPHAPDAGVRARRAVA